MCTRSTKPIFVKDHLKGKYQIAIIITIMVLELKVPYGVTLDAKLQYACYPSTSCAYE